jgi:hypothetical protein
MLFWVKGLMMFRIVAMSLLVFGLTSVRADARDLLPTRTRALPPTAFSK